MPFIDSAELEYRELIAGFRVYFIHSEHMTFAHWIIAADAVLPEHSHPHEQVANVLDGKFELTIEGRTKVLSPGDVGIIPPNAVHSGRAVTDCRIIDAFYPVILDFNGYSKSLI